MKLTSYGGFNYAAFSSSPLYRLNFSLSLERNVYPLGTINLKI